MAGDSGDGGRDAGGSSRPIEQLPGLSPDAIASLKVRWIHTVEQLLALASSKSGRAGLRSLCQVDDKALDALLAKGAALVGQEAAARLAKGTPGGPLGMELTEEQKRQFGVKEPGAKEARPGPETHDADHGPDAD